MAAVKFFFARSAYERIPILSTFKIVAPPLNVAHHCFFRSTQLAIRCFWGWKE